MDNRENVQFRLVNGNGEVFNYVFDKQANVYQLNMGKKPPGVYTFNAKTNRSDVQYSRSGKFIVIESNLETDNQMSNRILMNQIAMQSGGKVFDLSEVNTLNAEINAEPLVYTKTKSKAYADLLNRKLLFVILALFLTVEWFFRKYWGII